MKLQQTFTLERPRDDVWAFFHDVPAVADCLPGAEYLGTNEDGTHKGKMSVKVGPFQAAFEGAADVTYDDAEHTVAMSGKGVDKRGASRGKMKMECALIDEGGGTKVTIDADVQLSGAIAQFGRTGIIEEIAGTLISDFVSNVEEALPPPATAAGAEAEQGSEAAQARPARSASRGGARKSKPLSGTRLLWITLRNWGRRLLSTK
ncbi:CoxG family protein [Roseisalinus antarcticus]|uniref:Carbon monoxide dehydrogenase subunit G (CoxG) n=1 Tax=Roseisalinus antarcticus TaxID=254357 RepID=A0A1Y5TSC2_9RHOB|nr:SRPBCC family protein [Roseisalinus antarcticus]SLN70778.1 Carbon monoxide dehydrogenase subunit G (CoxG) [Roseisalinus antarcticus]